ncbi:hypothetical protein EDC01DRAFT_629843 [Geopyxis carbonaria]|nr:hypothetical protein EDC01DRAFT_629843 [Geopyxis carbonaria]
MSSASVRSSSSCMEFSAPEDEWYGYKNQPSERKRLLSENDTRSPSWNTLNIVTSLKNFQADLAQCDIATGQFLLLDFDQYGLIQCGQPPGPVEPYLPDGYKLPRHWEFCTILGLKFVGAKEDLEGISIEDEMRDVGYKLERLYLRPRQASKNELDDHCFFKKRVADQDISPISDVESQENQIDTHTASDTDSTISSYKSASNELQSMPGTWREPRDEDETCRISEDGNLCISQSIDKGEEQKYEVTRVYAPRVDQVEKHKIWVATPTSGDSEATAAVEVDGDQEKNGDNETTGGSYGSDNATLGDVCDSLRLTWKETPSPVTEGQALVRTGMGLRYLRDSSGSIPVLQDLFRSPPKKRKSEFFKRIFQRFRRA